MRIRCDICDEVERKVHIPCINHDGTGTTCVMDIGKGPCHGPSNIVVIERTSFDDKAIITDLEFIGKNLDAFIKQEQGEWEDQEQFHDLMEKEYFNFMVADYPKIIKDLPESIQKYVREDDEFHIHSCKRRAELYGDIRAEYSADLHMTKHSQHIDDFIRMILDIKRSYRK